MSAERPAFDPSAAQTTESGLVIIALGDVPAEFRGTGAVACAYTIGYADAVAGDSVDHDLLARLVGELPHGLVESYGAGYRRGLREVGGRR